MLTLLCVVQTYAQNCEPQTSGLYISDTPDKDGNRRYLRFTENKTVLSVFSDERTDYIFRWLKSGQDGIDEANYKMEGCTIKYSIKKNKDRYFFTGKLTDDHIHLKIYKSKNNKPLEFDYNFKELKK